MSMSGPSGIHSGDDLGIAVGSLCFPRRKKNLFSLSKEPILLEDLVHLVNDGAHDLEMDVLNRMVGILLKNIAVADVHPADESDLSIYNQHFSVVSQVNEMPETPLVGRHETGVVNFVSIQVHIDRRLAVLYPHVVDKNPNLDSPVLGSRKGFHKLQTGWVAIQKYRS